MGNTRKSKFLKYANSILKLSIPGDGDPIEDPETGNLIFPSETVEIQACLKPSTSKDDLKNQFFPTIDAASIYLSGWFVDPPNFDVKTPFECDAVIDGKEGRFYAVPRISSPFGVEKYTGKKITGYFTHREGN